MNPISHCINCGKDWKNQHYGDGEGITMMSYYCQSCDKQFAIFVEDQSI